MERLYNESSAAAAQDVRVCIISSLIEDAFKKTWGFIEMWDICPRDTELLCHNILSVLFAEKILVKATKKRNTKTRVDNEATEIMSMLPKVTLFPSKEDINKEITVGYNKQVPNAFVALSSDGSRLEIFPVEGGWLGFDPHTAQGDIAPFSD